MNHMAHHPQSEEEEVVNQQCSTTDQSHWLTTSSITQFINLMKRELMCGLQGEEVRRRLAQKDVGVAK